MPILHIFRLLPSSSICGLQYSLNKVEYLDHREKGDRGVSTISNAPQSTDKMSDATKTASQILFQNSLAEVVRKIRNSKKNEQDTIKQILGEIKSEISSPALSVKVTAVVKATYFAMLGYSADYGAFNIIEVMADSHFPNKRAGYVAASLTFTEHTDVLLLATALLKRDMMSANQYEVGLALYCKIGRAHV